MNELNKLLFETAMHYFQHNKNLQLKVLKQTTTTKS